MLDEQQHKPASNDEPYDALSGLSDLYLKLGTPVAPVEAQDDEQELAQLPAEHRLTAKRLNVVQTVAIAAIMAFAAAGILGLRAYFSHPQFPLSAPQVIDIRLPTTAVTGAGSQSAARLSEMPALPVAGTLALKSPGQRTPSTSQLVPMANGRIAIARGSAIAMLNSAGLTVETVELPEAPTALSAALDGSLLVATTQELLRIVPGQRKPQALFRARTGWSLAGGIALAGKQIMLAQSLLSTQGGLGETSVRALDLGGAQQWEHNFPAALSADLVAADNGVYVQLRTDQRAVAAELHRLDAKGTELWKTPLTVAAGTSPLLLPGGDIAAVLVSSRQYDTYELAQVSAGTGAIEWRVAIDGQPTGALVPLANGSVLVRTQGGLAMSIDASGQREWILPAALGELGGAAVAGPDGTQLLPLRLGLKYSPDTGAPALLELKAGQPARIWRLGPSSAGSFARPADSLVVADDHLLTSGYGLPVAVYTWPVKGGS